MMRKYETGLKSLKFRFTFCKSKIIWHLKVYFGWARIYLDVTDYTDILNHLMCNGLFDFNIFKKNMYHVNINLLHLVAVTWSGYFLDPFQVFGDSGKNAWWIEIGTPCAPANQPNNVGCSATWTSGPHVSPSVERTTTVAWKWPSLWYTCRQNVWSGVACLWSKIPMFQRAGTREGCHSNQIINIWFLWHEELAI